MPISWEALLTVLPVRGYGVRRSGVVLGRRGSAWWIPNAHPVGATPRSTGCHSPHSWSHTNCGLIHDAMNTQNWRSVEDDAFPDDTAYCPKTGSPPPWSGLRRRWTPAS